MRSWLSSILRSLAFWSACACLVTVAVCYLPWQFQTQEANKTVERADGFQSSAILTSDLTIRGLGFWVGRLIATCSFVLALVLLAEAFLTRFSYLACYTSWALVALALAILVTAVSWLLLSPSGATDTTIPGPDGETNIHEVTSFGAGPFVTLSCAVLLGLLGVRKRSIRVSQH